MKTEHNTTDDGENRVESESEDEAENEKYDEELHYISQRLEVIKSELNELQTRQVSSFVSSFSPQHPSLGGADPKEGAT